MKGQQEIRSLAVVHVDGPPRGLFRFHKPTPPTLPFLLCSHPDGLKGILRGSWMLAVQSYSQNCPSLPLPQPLLAPELVSPDQQATEDSQHKDPIETGIRGEMPYLVGM